MLGINFKKCMFVGLALFVVSSILCATDAHAVFENLTSTGWTVFKGMRKIIFAAAGFGIIAVAIGGFFGVLNWKWLSAIIIGLVVIATTVGIVNYMTAGTGYSVSADQVTDMMINP